MNGGGFSIQGVVNEPGNQVLVAHFNTTVLAPLANVCITCDPVEARPVREEIRDIDLQVNELISRLAELSARRNRLLMEIDVMLRNPNPANRKHKAVQAFGHRVQAALNLFISGNNPTNIPILDPADVEWEDVVAEV